MRFCRLNLLVLECCPPFCQSALRGFKCNKSENWTASVNDLIAPVTADGKICSALKYVHYLSDLNSSEQNVHAAVSHFGRCFIIFIRQLNRFEPGALRRTRCKVTAVISMCKIHIDY